MIVDDEMIDAQLINDTQSNRGMMYVCTSTGMGMATYGLWPQDNLYNEFFRKSWSREPFFLVS